MSDNDKKRLGLAEGFIIILLIGIVTLLFWVSSLSSRLNEVEGKVEELDKP